MGLDEPEARPSYAILQLTHTLAVSALAYLLGCCTRPGDRLLKATRITFWRFEWGVTCTLHHVQPTSSVLWRAWWVGVANL
jgi:hypothetical protein